ncbi:hypothetical protein J1N35_004989 [Gossypium stocksii]|uniref:Uncharacterized protein n=1 Tax=Gossypium stocksii TaxID=47602 RepID=A0A9D3WC07_9ROSI|nr:hypothetical protein J1N35_004989 [Gossypium stocksii]
MREMLQEIPEALPPREKAVHGVPNLDLKDPYIIINHPELDNSNQQEFRTEDHRDELNMTEAVSNLIEVKSDIAVDIVANIKVEVTTNRELKSILNGSVENPTHFLALAKNVLAKEIDEFDSFSSDKGNKTRVTKTSRDMEGMKLKAIIPHKTI